MNQQVIILCWNPKSINYVQGLKNYRTLKNPWLNNKIKTFVDLERYNTNGNLLLQALSGFFKLEARLCSSARTKNILKYYLKIVQFNVSCMSQLCRGKKNFSSIHLFEQKSKAEKQNKVAEKSIVVSYSR